VHRAVARPAPSAPSFVTLPATQARIVGLQDVRRLRRAPFTDVRTAVEQSLGLSLSAAVRPLVVSRLSLRPRERITVIAARLRNRRRHRIALLLLGPGYSARRLIVADGGLAGATIALPSHLSPGRWIIATEDLSGVRLPKDRKPVGRAEDRVGVFTVPVHRVSSRPRRSPRA
jgi:hypothetical protein